MTILVIINDFTSVETIYAVGLSLRECTSMLLELSLQLPTGYTPECR